MGSGQLSFPSIHSILHMYHLTLWPADPASAPQAFSNVAAEGQALRTAAADTEKSLQRCKAADRQRQEREEAAAAQALQLAQDRLHAEEALAACDGALKQALQRLTRSEQDAATGKEVST